MSKHVRKSEHIQPGKSHETELILADRPDRGGTEISGAVPLAEGPTEAAPVGKYWIVIILWVAAFATMIGFEILSAIFKR